MFFEGFEDNPSLAQFYTLWTSVNTTTWSIQTTGAHQSNGYGSSYTLNVRYAFDLSGICCFSPVVPGDNKWAQVFINSSALATSEVVICGALGVLAGCSIFWHTPAAGGQLEIRRGNGYGATLAASASALPRGVPHTLWILFDLKTAGGTVAVYVDQSTTPFVSYTGNTTALGTDGFNSIGLGIRNDGNPEIYFDDIVILTDAEKAAIPALNAPLGIANPPTAELFVTAGIPTGNDVVDFTPSAGTNWQNVDSRPFDSVTYNEGTVAGQQDTYRWPGLPFDPLAVCGAKVTFYGARDGAINTFSGVLKSGPTISVGAAQAIAAAGAFVYREQYYPVDPNTGVQWVLADVNVTKFGARIG